MVNIRKRTIDVNFYEVLLVMAMAGGLWLKIIYSQLSTKINKVPIMNPKNEFMFGMSLLTVIIVFSLIYALGHKHGLRLVSVTAALLGAVILADTLYGRYYYNPITLSIFNQLTMADNIATSAFSLIKWKDLIFFLDFAVIGVVVVSRKHLKFEFTGNGHFGRRLIVGAIVFVLALTLFNVRYSKAETIHYAYERKYIARDMGLLYYHGYDVVKNLEKLNRSSKVTEEEAALIQAYNGYDLQESNTYTGVAEGYNLVVIQVEAMMDYLVGYEVDGVKVTPFLEELMKDSLYLSSNYFQTANGNTVDAEFMMTTSLLPTHSGSVYYEFPTNTFHSLPRILEAEGYRSFSFHGFEASFWNREVMHRTLGFERFYSLGDFDVTDKIGWAISDEAFYDQSMEKLLDQVGSDPFFGMMITLSSHHPYDGFLEGPFTGTQGRTTLVNHYYNSIHYVDQTIEAYFQMLKDEGLYDKTIVVIYGDHGGLFGSDAVSQAEADGNLYDPFVWMKYQQIPVMIHVPGAFEGGVEVANVTGQIDILPTVANLMGLDLPYTLGQDVLDDQYDGLVVKRFGDVITDDFIYISDEQKVFDYESGEVLEYSDYADRILEAHRYLEVTDLILERDYFKNYEQTE